MPVPCQTFFCFLLADQLGALTLDGLLAMPLIPHEHDYYVSLATFNVCTTIYYPSGIWADYNEDAHKYEVMSRNERVFTQALLPCNFPSPSDYSTL